MSLPNSLPRNIWVLGIGSLLMDSSSEMIHAVLPLFLVNSLAATMITVGLIEGCAEAVASLLRVFSGVLSDYSGRRKPLILAGYALSSVSKPLFAIANSLTLVVVARVSDRIGKGVRGAPRDALVADSTTEEQRGAAYGLRQSLDTIGAIVGPSIALFVLAVYPKDYRLVFWIAVIPALLAVLALSFGIEEPGMRTQDRNKHRFDPRTWANLNKSYWWLLVVAFVFNLGNSSDAFLILKAKTIGIQDAVIPLVLIIFNASYAATSYPAGWLSDRFGRKSLFVAGLVLYAVNYTGLAFVVLPSHFWLLCISYGVQLGISQGTLLAMISDRVPQNLRGTAFGFINLSVAVAVLGASTLAGFLWQTSGTRYAFLAGAGFALLSLAIYLVTDRLVAGRPGVPDHLQS